MMLMFVRAFHAPNRPHSPTKQREPAGGASPPSSARNVPAAPGTALAGALPEAFPVAFWGWPTWVKRRSGGGKSYCINSKRRPGGATGSDLRGMLLDEVGRSTREEGRNLKATTTACGGKEPSKGRFLLYMSMSVFGSAFTKHLCTYWIMLR